MRACVLLPSTGDSEDHGAEMRRGMAIAQAEVAAQPWRTRAIEWIEQDTKSTEAGAAEAFERCYGEGIRVVVGPVAPPAVSAILHVAKAHEALLVVPDLGPVPVSVWSDHILAVAHGAACGHCG